MVNAPSDVIALPMTGMVDIDSIISYMWDTASSLNTQVHAENNPLGSLATPVRSDDSANRSPLASANAPASHERTQQQDGQKGATRKRHALL